MIDRTSCRSSQLRRRRARAMVAAPPDGSASANAPVATWCSFDAPGPNSHRQRDVRNGSWQHNPASPLISHGSVCCSVSAARAHRGVLPLRVPGTPLLPRIPAARGKGAPSARGHRPVPCGGSAAMRYGFLFPSWISVFECCFLVRSDLNHREINRFPTSLFPKIKEPPKYVLPIRCRIYLVGEQ